MYRLHIPFFALINTYRLVTEVAFLRGPFVITESQTWRLQAILHLWPMPGLMTWDLFGFVLTALADFARTQGHVGFRFDVYFQGLLVGFGAVAPNGYLQEASNG